MLILLVSSGIPKQNLDVMIVDFSSQASIHKFANDIKSKYQAIHGLVNNAAVGGTPSKQFSVDGIELTFATNVIGYFLMSTLLSDLLIKGAPSRIVNIASNYAGGIPKHVISFNILQD
jgi:NAD(P)-dependent dehydrogenase (short-subunit alcohol dehydrogenase family)